MLTEPVTIGNATLYCAPSEDVLVTLPDNSVDSIVTDPPYGLGFMGKKWDIGVPAVTLFRECLRVLKPGGHLLAFGGARTYHRLAVAVEDAGFEIRDQIMWIYGSGFPKSQNVSKAIDWAGGDPLAWRAFSVAYGKAVARSGLTHTEIDRRLGLASAGSNSCYWARTDHRGALPPRHHWETVRDLLGLPIEMVGLYDQAEREVLAIEKRKNAPSGIVSAGRESVDVEREITAPATDAARQWDGWGTALKPAHEPIVVARKPLDGTVAANVLRHGTGAINVDGCRVETDENLNGGAYSGGARPTSAMGCTGEAGGTSSILEAGGGRLDPSAFRQPAGRWPANIIHDGSEEVVSLFPSQAGAAAPVHKRGSDKFRNSYGKFEGNVDEGGSTFQGDKGSAARFFYCAKASRKDRNEGCEALAERPLLWSSGTQSPGTFQAEGTKRAANNNHPTVKPTDLMRYLCRLVTPPGGTVLDPFMGSGSTGKAALQEGFAFIGIDKDADYFPIAEARITHCHDNAQRQGRLAI